MGCQNSKSKQNQTKKADQRTPQTSSHSNHINNTVKRLNKKPSIQFEKFLATNTLTCDIKSKKNVVAHTNSDRVLSKICTYHTENLIQYNEEQISIDQTACGYKTNLSINQHNVNQTPQQKQSQKFDFQFRACKGQSESKIKSGTTTMSPLGNMQENTSPNKIQETRNSKKHHSKGQHTNLTQNQKNENLKDLNKFLEEKFGIKSKKNQVSSAQQLQQDEDISNQDQSGNMKYQFAYLGNNYIDNDICPYNQNAVTA